MNELDEQIETKEDLSTNGNLAVSLNKAAHLLGVTEINKFDYKSLNSIRKLAKTLGCNEFDLMKSFQNQQQTEQLSNSPSKSNQALIVEKKISNKKFNTLSCKNKQSNTNSSHRAASFTKKEACDSLCNPVKSNTTIPTTENVNFNDNNNNNNNNNYKKLLNIKKIGFQKAIASNLKKEADYICNSSSRAENNNLKSEISKKLNESDSSAIVGTEERMLAKLANDQLEENDAFNNNNINNKEKNLFKRNLSNTKKIQNRFNQRQAKQTNLPRPEEDGGDKTEQHNKENQDIEDTEKDYNDEENSEIGEAEYFDIERIECQMQSNQQSADKASSQLKTQKREVTLFKDQSMGFGFIAGSEKPLVIRFVSPDGPGQNKLLNGDEVLAINGEDVEYASRDYVINLIRNSSDQLDLVVKQPTPKSTNSLLLTEDKKAFKKSAKYKNKVRFNLSENDKFHEAESIYCDMFENEQFDEEIHFENNDDLKQSIQLDSACKFESDSIESDESHNDSLNDNAHKSTESKKKDQFISKEDHNSMLTENCNSSSLDRSADQMISILKVHLENQTVKSFKYDKNTCVRDVLNCLKEKLNIACIENYGLVLRLNNHNCVSSFIMLEETRYLFRLREQYGSDANYHCMFRFIFVPTSYQDLISNDEFSFNYLYEQSCNDIINERFGNELKYEIVLHLATLSILHDHIINYPSIELKCINDSCLQKFLPRTFLESAVIKQIDLKRLVNQNLEWFYEKNFLNKYDIKLEYLKSMNELLQYSGRIFFVNLLNEMKETFIIIGSSHGIATFIDIKTKTLLNLAKFESIENIRVAAMSEYSNLVRIDLDLFETTQTNEIAHKTLTFGFLREDYLQFLYLLQGYLRINVYPIKHRLCPIQEIKSSHLDLLNVAVFLVKYPQIKNNEIKDNLDPEKNCCVLKMSTNVTDYSLFKLKLADQTNDCLNENPSKLESNTKSVLVGDELNKSDLLGSEAFNTTEPKILEANKEELIIYETTNTLYDEINELSQKIVFKSANADLNTESLPLIESCHFEMSDTKMHQDDTDYKFDFEQDQEQQTEEIIYCFDFRTSEEMARNAKEETISLSSIEPENENNNCNGNKLNRLDASSPLPQTTTLTESNIHKKEEANEYLSKESSIEEKVSSISSLSSVCSSSALNIYYNPSSSVFVNDFIQEHNLLELEEEKTQQKEEKQQIKEEEEKGKEKEKEKEDKEKKEEKEEKLELYSVGHKIDHFNRIMLQNNGNNLVNFHKSTTIASACFRQIKKPIQIEYTEVDVIDLTQIHNQNIIITPPPLQFSDEYRNNNNNNNHNNNNELKANDVEIESGIESDSSADQQVSEALAAAAAALVVNSSLITKQTDDINSKTTTTTTTTTTNNNNNCIAIREDQRGEEFLNAKHKIITDARFSSKLLINLDNSSSASSPTLSRRENSIDKTNYFKSNNNNNNNNNNNSNNSSYISGSSIVPIINSKQQQHIRETDNKQRESSNSTFSNNHVSYESKINHFVDAYSLETTSNTNTVKHSQPNQQSHVSESKFTLINYHQPQPTKFSNSSSALSYLNEIEIPARIKRSSSFRSNSKKQQHQQQQQQQQQQHLIAQKASQVDIQTRDQVKQTTPMTDSGFMSSFNSLSSSNSSSPPLLLSASKPMSTSPSSSSSSSPTSLSKVISNDNDHQSNRTNPTNVKTIAKTYELNTTNGNNSNNNNASSNILPSYFKPKLNSANEKPNSIIKIINNNTESSRLIRTKFDSFEMPDAQAVSTAGAACVGPTKKEEKEISKQPEITSLNVNEIILDSSSSHGLSSKQTKINDASNETSQQSSSSASSGLTKQKLVKLNLTKSFDNDLEIKKSSGQNNPSSFHKVLNKIVETGISSFTPSTSFSKPPIASSSSSSSSSSKKQTYNNFEPINGYEDKTVGNEPTGPVVGDSKLKKKHSYSYKSSSLTRQGKQSDENKKNLFKLNEFESINISKLSTEQHQLKQSSPSQTVPAKKQEKTYNFFSNFNGSNVSKDASSTNKSKGYNISSSLPSRNLGNKVVEDIKSLFDKFTNPSSAKNAQNRLAKTAENDENLVQNDSISSSSSQQTSHEAARLSTFKSENASRLKQSKSFSANHSKQETDLYINGKASFAKFDYECPDSPRKGALKKLSSRDSSATRSPLKVRWKDMIEISDLVEDVDNDSENYSSDDSLNHQTDEPKKINGTAVDSDTENYHSIDSFSTRQKSKTKKKKLKKKGSTSKPSQDDSFDIIITSEKKNYIATTNRKCEGKQQQFNLKPLHSTGKQFEKEMTERLNKLNQIKAKTNVDNQSTEKFYDEIHCDLDVVLFELHSTIEHVRLSSMISNVKTENEITENVETIESNSKIEEKISSVAQICRQFVNNSKNMISSALVNESEVKTFVRNAMNSLCSLVVQCLESNYDYMNKNKKLDETRQLLIQILNLLNTFRTTLNITYLASSKQLNEGNMNLLMKQATNLANEISLLIKHFKLLF